MRARTALLLIACSSIACGGADGSEGSGAVAGSGSGAAGSGGSGPGGASSGEAGAASGGTAGASGLGGADAVERACVPLGGPDGVDSTFVPHDGLVEVQSWDVTVDYQNRVIVSGFRSGADGKPAMVRMTENGARDRSFGDEAHAVLTGGVLSDNLSIQAPRGIAADRDGRVWMVADLDLGPPANEDYGMLARFAADGTRDTSFAPAEQSPGAALLQPPAGYDLAAPSFQAVIPDGSGAWVLGFGYATRVSEDGSYDPAVTPIAAGRRLARGSGVIYTTDFDRPHDIAAFDESGAPRTSWGSDGWVTLPAPPEGTFDIHFMLSEPSGGLVLVGGNRAARLTPEGILDSAFGEGGYSAASACTFVAANLGCEGRIVMVGEGDATHVCAVALTPEGAPVPEAPAGGVFSWEVPSDFVTDEIAIEPERGRFVLLDIASRAALLRIAPPWSG